MEKDLVGINFVITAHNFNPSVFNQMWLVKNGIVKEDESLQGSIFADGISQVITKDFSLLVLPEQLQLSLNEKNLSSSLLVSKARNIVEKLPETPFLGLGINFIWNLSTSDAEFNKLTKDLFYNDKKELYKKFNTDDSRYGAYLSKDIGKVRLKLDIKPVLTQKVPNGALVNKLLLIFNFHRDLTKGKATEDLLATLNMWDSFKSETESIMECIK